MLLDYSWSEDELAQVEDHANGQVGLEPPPQSSPGIGGIGHNNPLQLEDTRIAQQIEAIVDSKYSAIKKLILLKIRLRADHKTFSGAYPSYATLMRAASAKDDRTIQGAIRDLVTEGILTREERSGLSFIYGFSREKLEALIGEHVAQLRKRKQGYARPTSSHGPPSFHVGGTSDAPSWHVPQSTLSLGDEERIAPRAPTPHIDETGFVISAEHGLVVPMQKVQEWRERFPHIPDLEAALTNLATTILAKGRMHPGWTSPEGWMVKPLAEINQEAADKKQITAARVARASNRSASAQTPRGKSRRRELDEA